ncbi:Predicted arabinose efflux permease, MFS family [Microbispora rosea]|uniref:Predicted arabinose efflux permease, MFS family n=1 Tax=Microbispora rosea TaxID=58117 RepID=A0A1N7EML3_9ACTN|nr:MFS transporter [Microbispora rosea]GIH50079.1 MFS transporter [Microbispora rosea subsp. rosea]SIR89321.1 Predicted arabinose efflux permease, MFS family [Microbispora rosea]
MLRSPGFGRYLTGFGMSLVGDQIWFIALGWAAARMGDPRQTALIMTAASVPRAVLILLGGTVADRYGPLRVTLASQTLRATLMLTFAVAVVTTSTPHLWLLIGVALLFGALDAAHMPAAAALPPSLLQPHQLPAGQGLVQTLERTATVLGAPLGGILVATGGPGLAAAANAALFTAALLSLRSLRFPVRPQAGEPVNPHGPENLFASLWTGLRYVATTPVLGPILLVVTTLNLVVAAPLNVGVALLAGNRGWNATGFSLVISGFGIGAVAGALLQVALPSPRKPAVAGLRWVAAGAACIALLPFVPGLPLTAVTAAALGFTAGPASALLLGVVQANTDHAYLGRVMALVSFSALGLVPVSYTVFGVMVEHFDLQAAFGACAIAEVVAVGAALCTRSIRTTTTPRTVPRKDPATADRDRPA